MMRSLYIIIGVVLFIACGERQEYVSTLERAEVVMNDHPDSALAVLDSLSTHEQEFGKRFRMRYQLLRLQAQNKAFVPFTSDSLAKDVVGYFDRHGSHNEQMKAHYLLGCVYRDLGEAPHAADCYLDAISKADTTANDCDFYTLSCVYSQMADIYHQQLLLSYAIDARKYASNYALRANKMLYCIHNMESVAGTFILMNKIDSAEILLKNVQYLYTKYGYNQKALQASTKLLYLYVEHNRNLLEAKHIIDKFDREYLLFDNKGELPAAKRQYFYYKGKYYEDVNKLDSAEYYYRKVYRPDMSFSSLDPMYRGLLSVFQKRQIPDSISKYTRLFTNANDSSIAEKDQQLMAQMAASYNYNRYQKEAMEKEKEANRIRLLLLVFSIIVVLIIYIIWKYYRNAQKRKQKELDDLEKEYAKALDEYNSNLHTLELLDKSHKIVIDTIQKELESELITNKSFQTKIAEINTQYKNDQEELQAENENLRLKIEEMKYQEGISKYLVKSEEFVNTDIVKRVKDSMNNPLVKMSDEEWAQLITIGSLYYPTLLHDLNNSPKLTIQHIRVCILVTLNIRGTDIANKMGITEQRVTNIKSELNQVLFGENSARSLYKNLVGRYNTYSLL